MTGSVAFDRVAELYDRTRALPPEIMVHVVDTLAGELVGAGRCLEIGVGTGRIARPMAAAGADLVGVDLSLPMLTKLVEQAGGTAPFPVLRGDATALPFRENSFGAAYFVHVFHLISQWRAAVDELVRVVRPGGTVLADMGGGQVGPEVNDLNDHFQAAARIEQRFVGLREVGDLDAAFAAHGARLRLLPPLTVRGPWTPETLLRNLEGNVYSWTWQLDDETRARAAAATRAWALDRYGDLRAPHEYTLTVAWRAYDLRA